MPTQSALQLNSTHMKHSGNKKNEWSYSMQLNRRKNKTIHQLEFHKELSEAASVP